MWRVVLALAAIALSGFNAVARENHSGERREARAERDTSRPKPKQPRRKLTKAETIELIRKQAKKNGKEVSKDDIARRPTSAGRFHVHAWNNEESPTWHFGPLPTIWTLRG